MINSKLRHLDEVFLYQGALYSVLYTIARTNNFVIYLDIIIFILSIVSISSAFKIINPKFKCLLLFIGMFSISAASVLQ